MPTAAKFFAKAHVRAKDKSFADDRSKAIWDRYQSLKVAKQVPPSQEYDGIFLEAAGGWSEKGTVYGLGNAAEYFYEKPTAGTTSGKPSYTPSIVSQLQNELDSTKAELNSTKNELQSIYGEVTTKDAEATLTTGEATIDDGGAKTNVVSHASPNEDHVSTIARLVNLM